MRRPVREPLMDERDSARLIAYYYQACTILCTDQKQDNYDCCLILVDSTGTAARL